MHFHLFQSIRFNSSLFELALSQFSHTGLEYYFRYCFLFPLIRHAPEIVFTAPWQSDAEHLSPFWHVPH
jgi:hypothetical protein